MQEKKDQSTEGISIFADSLGSEHAKQALNLEISSFKVPTAKPLTRNRPLHPIIRRFNVPHTLTDGASSVLLVTRDFPKRGADVKMSNAHYKTMLTNAGCNNLVSEIMTLSELKGELVELDSRKNLCSRIDTVLCDSNIVKVVPRVLGRPFLVAKKYPLSVKLDSRKLKEVIAKTLSQSCHKMTFRNTQSALVFGHSHQSVSHLKDNLIASIKYLKEKFPGGWNNIKTLYVTCGLKSRVPLYISQGKASDTKSCRIQMPTEEVISGDFGFGNIRMNTSGKIFEYTPDSDEEGCNRPKMSAKEKRAKRLAKHKKKAEAKLLGIKGKKSKILTSEERVEEIQKLLRGDTVYTVKSDVRKSKLNTRRPDKKDKKKKAPKKKTQEKLLMTELEEGI